MLTRILSAAALLLISLSSAAQAGEYKTAGLKVSHAWSRATPKLTPTGAGFLRIENTGSAGDRLLAVECDCAEIVQLHEMQREGGIMKMQEVEGGIELPPGETTVLQPGGLHVMFIRLAKPFAVGDEIKARLTFEHAAPLDIAFTVEPLRGKRSHGMHGKTN